MGIPEGSFTSEQSQREPVLQSVNRNYCCILGVILHPERPESLPWASRKDPSTPKSSSTHAVPTATLPQKRRVLAYSSFVGHNSDRCAAAVSCTTKSGSTESIQDTAHKGEQCSSCSTYYAAHRQPPRARFSPPRIRKRGRNNNKHRCSATTD